MLIVIRLLYKGKEVIKTTAEGRVIILSGILTKIVLPTNGLDGCAGVKGWEDAPCGCMFHKLSLLFKVLHCNDCKA